MADAKIAEETVQEVLDGRREFTLEAPENEISHYYITNPSGEDIRKAEWQYSKVFNQAIVDGFLTMAQMLDVLKDKGIISDGYEQDLENVRIALGAELFKLENLMDNATEEEREIVALEVARLRDDLFQLNQRVNGPMSNTCENLAEDARTDYLTSRIVEKKDGSKLWPTFEDYKKEDNTALAVKSRFEVMLWMQGLESNFLENTPEQTALREIAQQRLERSIEETRKEAQEALDSVEETLESTDISDAEPEDEEPGEKVEPKKPRGRPKGSRNKAKTKTRAKKTTKESKPESEPEKTE